MTDKPIATHTTYGWMVLVDVDCMLIWPQKQAAINNFRRMMIGKNGTDKIKPWRYWYNRGFRCFRVSVGDIPQELWER